MKKRILALALCLCMVALWVPVTARAATSVSDAKAYLDVLSQQEYVYSDLIDFDVDGRDELLAIWLTHDESWNFSVHVGVWQGAKKLTEITAEFSHVAKEFSIYQRDGKFYLCRSSYVSYAFYTIQNGQWVEVETLTDPAELDGGDRDVFFAKLNAYTYLYHVFIPASDAADKSDAHSELCAALTRKALIADVQAYLDILDSQSYSSSYLIDFDGDGRSELLLVRQQNGYPHYSVWQGSKLLIDEPAEVVQAPTFCLYSKDGKSYLCFGDDIIDFAFCTFCTVENGAWVEAAKFEYEIPDFDPGLNVDWFTDEWTIYTISGKQVKKAEYDRQFNAYKRQYDVYPWGTEGIDVRPLLTELAMQTMKPADILKKITYYGDVSKCKLSAKQAEAMADALDNWKDDAGYGTGTPLCAYLVDGDGSGIPALVVVSTYYDYFFDDNEQYQAADILDLYTWEAGGLTETSLETHYIGLAGYTYTNFGKLPNGQYAWNSEFGHQGLMSFQRFSLKNGALVKGDLYESGSSFSPLYFSKNGQTIEERRLEDTNGNDNLWYDWQSEVYDMYEDATEPDRLESRIDYEVGNNKNELASLLRAYAKSRKFPSYTYALLDAAESAYDKLLSAVGVSEAAEVHTLADGLYYVIYPSGEAYQGALVREIRENGKRSFRLERTDPAPVEQAALEPIVTEALTKPNFTLDFSRIRRTATLEELRTYLEELLANMDAPTPNDPTKSDLAAFVDSAVSTLSTQTLSGTKNHLTPDSDTVSQLVQKAQEVYDSLTATLEENEVTLNKTVTPTVRAVWSNVDLGKPCQIDLDRLAARALDGCNLQLLLGDAQTWLGFTADDLKELTRELDGALRLQFSQEGDKVYALRFLNEDGEVVEQLSRPITVSLPAASALDTIMVSYADGSDNWGGQFDPAAGAISFEARYSGQYEVLENSVDIDDIEGLSEESRAAISFMVSKGYLSADNGLFRPSDPLTRYEFTEALVGMFFALDRDLTCDFPDVDPSSPYYPYVASAQAKSIVNGYDDGTFSGDDPINREQVFALAARTLMDQKGYAQPANFEQYLTSFTDRADLSAWAAPQVALSVREGVAGRGSVLLPQANITREQAAVVLYRLFQLLYEVSPAALDLPAGGGGLSLPVVIGVSVAAVAAVGGAAGVILYKKRKKPVSAE